MVRETPLLFSKSMVIALLKDRKTETRRIIPGLGLDAEYVRDEIIKGVKYAVFTSTSEQEVRIRIPNQSNDKIWVRETWALPTDGDGNDVGYLFRADFDEQVPWKWSPSLHMPKDAARIWLEVTDCFPQRLQSITRESCIAEGAHFDEGSGYWFAGECTVMAQGPDEAFRDLWYDINGVESWLQNPWVWVRRFIIISKTGKPL